MSAASLMDIICMLVPPSAQKYNGESETDAHGRYLTIAKAITEYTASDVEQHYLVTIARHESSFTRGVHSGEVRGDDGRSWGLYQELVGREPSKKVRGSTYRAEDLVGVDLAATIRATEVATSRVRQAVLACGANKPACVFAAYGGVTDVGDERIESRVRTYRRVRAAARGNDDNS